MTTNERAPSEALRQLPTELRAELQIAGITAAGGLRSPADRSIVAMQISGERMSAPTADYFVANLPGASQTVRVETLYDAKVFARRWVIRDKDPALKALLRHMEKANSSAVADAAIRQLKQALASRGLLVAANPSLTTSPPTR